MEREIEMDHASLATARDTDTVTEIPKPVLSCLQHTPLALAAQWTFSCLSQLCCPISHRLSQQDRTGFGGFHPQVTFHCTMRLRHRQVDPWLEVHSNQSAKGSLTVEEAKA
jgi:hypothetical protein